MRVRRFSEALQLAGGEGEGWRESPQCGGATPLVPRKTVARGRLGKQIGRGAFSKNHRVYEEVENATTGGKPREKVCASKPFICRGLCDINDMD